MNKKQLFLVTSMVALLAASPLQAGGKQRGQQGQQSSGSQTTAPVADALSGEEAADLTFMREEEKLARDVYKTLYKQWKAPVFSSISRSEQKHMDVMAAKLAAYDLPDPVVDNAVGSFVNSDLANLYAVLIAQGQASLLDALLVGALIEEVDIVDLQKAIARTTHPDLIMSYENLMRASRNHLRAFAGQIESLGVPYEAQLMDQLEVDMILDAPLERGRPKRRGGRR